MHKISSTHFGWKKKIVWLNMHLCNTSEISNLSLVCLLKKQHFSKVHNKGVHHLQKWIAALQYNPLVIFYLSTYLKRASSENSIHVVGFVILKNKN